MKRNKKLAQTDPIRGRLFSVILPTRHLASCRTILQLMNHHRLPFLDLLRSPYLQAPSTGTHPGHPAKEERILLIELVYVVVSYTIYISRMKSDYVK